MTSNKNIKGNFELLYLAIEQEIKLHPGNMSRTDIALLKQIEDYVTYLEGLNNDLIQVLDRR